MGKSPPWKVYDSFGDYQASCHELHAAAVLVSHYGDGSTIRAEHKVIAWIESEYHRAAESFDQVHLESYPSLTQARRMLEKRYRGKRSMDAMHSRMLNVIASQREDRR